MNTRNQAFALAWVLCAGVAVAQQDRPKTVAESVNSMWADEEKDFVGLAEAMPEAKWSFKPSGAGFKNIRTFAEQVKHVACANEAFAKEMRGAKPPEGCE